MTTPADELRTAAQKLRDIGPFALVMGPFPGLAEPLADWLDSWTGIDFNERAAMPEDLRHALAVARAINGGEQP